MFEIPQNHNTSSINRLQGVYRKYVRFSRITKESLNCYHQNYGKFPFLVIQIEDDCISTSDIRSLAKVPIDN